tara:strand:- start:323 stop:586 length:264 start_codon:yes stop_codon:yes gene_type:complete
MAFWRWLSRKDRKELEEAKVRISQLEREYRSMALTLQNLQSALVAISRNQDVVVNDVRHIQEMVSSFLHEIDPAQLIMGMASSKEDN